MTRPPAAALAAVLLLLGCGSKEEWPIGPGGSNFPPKNSSDARPPLDRSPAADRALPRSPLCNGLITDKAAHPMSALARPALLGAVVDPELKTTIRRITEASAAIVPLSSSLPAWSAGEQHLLLREPGVGLRLYDGKTYAFIKVVPINPSSHEQIFWHASQATVLLYLEGKNLYRYDVLADTQQTVHTFACTGTLSSGGYTSWSSGRLGLTCGPSGAERRFAYDLAKDLEGPSTTEGDLAPRAAPSGQLFVIGGSVRDFDMKPLRTLDLGSSYQNASLGRLAGGNDAWVGVQYEPGPKGCAIGAIVAHDLTDASCRVLVGPSTGFPYPPAGVQVSTAPASGWAAAAIVGSVTGQGVLDQEIVLAELGDSGAVCRVAHHRSHGDSGFSDHANPTPVLSPSGTRILFASDWGGGQTVDSYVVELPSYLP